MTIRRFLASGVSAITLSIGGPAFADHNSIWGEGWANMPNDIHNTRIETLNTGDRTAFRDFVRYGNGATSTNRFLTDSPARRSMRGRAGHGGGGRR